MSWERDLAALRERFDVIETPIPCAGREFVIAQPRNADVLINEHDFDRDERLPYWADVWPSARILADHVARMRGNGRETLELGCGSGLVACALAHAGFRVTATDYYDDALAFTRVNVARNTNRRAAIRLVDWRSLPRDLGRYDLVVAADVLYEHTHGELVAEAVCETLAPDGFALIADPGRLSLPAFLQEIEERGLVVDERWEVPSVVGDQRHVVQLHAIRVR